jgi:hypothetical protein
MFDALAAAGITIVVVAFDVWRVSPRLSRGNLMAAHVPECFRRHGVVGGLAYGDRHG